MPEPAQIGGQCADCRQDLEHCHGTAIVHPDAAADCSDDPGCRRPAALHLFEVPCAEVGCDCLPDSGCPPDSVVAAGQARAS